MNWPSTQLSGTTSNVQSTTSHTCTSYGMESNAQATDEPAKHYTIHANWLSPTPWRQIDKGQHTTTGRSHLVRGRTKKRYHDMSYWWLVQREEAPDICRTGWVIFYNQTEQHISGFFAKKSLSTSSYRGDLLGMLALHILFLTCKECFRIRSGDNRVYCNNKGAILMACKDQKRILTGTKIPTYNTSCAELR